MVDHVTAAAVYDGIKEHLGKLSMPFWLGLAASLLMALVAFLLRRRRGATEVVPSASAPTPSAPAEMLEVYFGGGPVESVPRAWCTIRAPEVPVKLRIANATTKYPIALPLVVDVAGRGGIVLFSFTGATAYAVSSECARPNVFNQMPSGSYDVELELPSSCLECWDLAIGYGGPPALKQKMNKMVV
jgi:hypothetical protein